MKYTTYVGAYTDEEHKEGVHVLEADSDTGSFRLLSAIDAKIDTVYMAFNRGNTMMYTAFGDPAFGPRGRNGGIAAYRLAGERKERLEFLNSVATGWTVPCHVSLDPANQALLYAEYSCGTAGYVDLAADGSLVAACGSKAGEINPRSQVQHSGSGPNLPRQDRAHAHCSIVTPDGRYQMVVDLALDKVLAYDFRNRANGMKVVPSASIDTGKLVPGAGPRHIVFHPSGKFAFVVFELYNLAMSFRYTGEGFVHVCTLPLLEGKAMEACKAAAIKVSEDGTQLFCSNRDISRSGFDAITVFNIDVDTGRLERLNIAKMDGCYPRDFEFFPGGKFCMVGLKESWRIASMAYDRQKGRFETVAQMEGIYRPLFFKFLK